MFIREYKPEGFSSWNAYYQHKAKIEKVKYFGECVLGMVIMFGVMAIDGILQL